MAADLQFGRRVSLAVGDDTGNALELGALRIVFNVRHGIANSPQLKSLAARVYNLSDDTAKRIGTD
jgi:hypothetical protein